MKIIAMGAMKFLANCTPGDYRANTLRVLRCMMSGLADLRALSAETGVGYNGNDEGILYLFRTARSFEERAAGWTEGVRQAAPSPIL